MEANKTLNKENGGKSRKRVYEHDLSPTDVSRRHLESFPNLSSHHSLYEKSFPFYRMPSEVGQFSLDKERRYHGDARKLRYYRPPTEGKWASPGWDLIDGYEDCYARRDEEEKEGLLHILTWAKDNQEKVGGPTGSGSKRLQISILILGGAATVRCTVCWDTVKSPDCFPRHYLCLPTLPVNRDFVTWRGHLTKILCTPFETQEGWLLAVTLFKGTFYLSEKETEAARKKRLERTCEQDKLMYSGYKFESYMCADTPDGSPNPSGVVNTNEGFCSVLLARLASHSILLSGEVDCVDPSASKPQPPSCYVELKSSAQIWNPHQQRSFNRYKLLKWWCQSFLLGIPLIVAGFRSQEGKVVALQKFRTSEIPLLVRGDKNSWDPAVCMNFCDAFLTHIKNVVNRDDPGLVYLFSWEPGSDVTCSMYSDPDLLILPPWYVEAMSR